MKYLKFMCALGLYAVTATVYAKSDALDDPGSQAVSIQSVADYWTAERMRAAKPMIPARVVSATSLETPVVAEQVELAEPGYVRGCLPGATNCDTSPRTLSSQDLAYSSSAAYGDLIEPMHGTKPVNPKDGPYGPFQRWREATPITAYPKSTVGKLFFTLNGGNWVCSASVIGLSTLITAGHCNSDGAGHFATNRKFCPSWNNGEDPTRGCWVVIDSKTSSAWHTTGDPDYDYACLITNPTGQKLANKVGTTTGTLGRAWNFAPSQAVRTFGYPQEAPFDGKRLQTTASTEWYTHNFTSGGQVSKIIGSDLTGGSSGGPWILGWTGGLTETADTDGSIATDPGTNWVTGVNSHKRCLTNCNNPPTAVNGVFWQEMTSPPFMNTAAADESEDIIAVCFANGGV